MRRSVAVVVVVLLAAACRATTRTPSDPTEAVIDTAGGPVTVAIEVADTQDERSKGLMGRTSLEPDAGMAFLFDGATTATFWMKDTPIPLSIAFWGGGGRILALLDMEPCPAEPCPTYSPGVEFAGALEVNRGFFEAHGVAVGDAVRLR